MVMHEFRTVSPVTDIFRDNFAQYLRYTWIRGDLIRTSIGTKVLRKRPCSFESCIKRLVNNYETQRDCH